MTYIIAEAGVNHNGSLQKGKELIKKAKEVGADCIKFQTFKTENLVTHRSPKANYQLKVTDQKESQFDMLKKLEIRYEDFKILKQECEKNSIEFISTPYNFEDVDFLDELDIKCFKIASGQLTELPFIEYVASKKREIILSTGMGNLSQVNDAVQLIRKFKIEPIILQCTTNYPSPIEDANLNAMITMREALKVKVGYSDHVQNNYACYAAVALGAQVIEKHFTLDKNDIGPDHSSSSNPSEFRSLVEGIRAIESVLGSGIKTPTDKEIKNIHGMKRSIVLKKDLEKGDLITIEDLEFKRPANGLDPNMINYIIGKKLKNNYLKNTPLNFNMIEW
jgi:N,N'-diacetyllegionaminate synthase